MKSSPDSISPSRERSAPLASVNRYDVDDVTDSQVSAEHETENGDPTVTPPISTTPTTVTTTPTTSETVDVANEEPPEPPRRRYARRSSATMYNLHNYAEQSQSQQGDVSH